MVRQEVLSAASNVLRTVEELEAFIDPIGPRIDRYNKIYNVSANADSLIVSYTVPSIYRFFLTGVVVSGSLDGEYIVYRDSSPILGIRTSSAKRTEQWIGNDKSNFAFAPGQVASIRVTHYETGKLGQFYGTLIGVLSTL
jgi:hypothetical protein